MNLLRLSFLVLVNVLAFAWLELSAKGVRPQGETRERVEKSYPFRPGGTVTLENQNGRVSVRAGAKPEVRVEAEKRVRAQNRRKAEELLSEVKIRIRASEDRIEILTNVPPGSEGEWSLWDWIFGDNRRHVEVDYQITVPDSCRVDMETSNGSIDIDGVRGVVRARSTNGAMELTDVSGRIEVETTNGAIRTELARTGGDQRVDLETTNGSITIALPRDIRATVEASTTNGSIHSDFPIEVQGPSRRERTRATVHINGGGGLMELRTTNGGIRIVER